jgi:hypothetical protein
MPVLEDLIPEDIPSQICRMNMSPILKSYIDMGIWNVAAMDMFVGKPAHHQLVNSAVR